MRLVRIRLRNFRGTTDREIAFRTDGITIVAGPNEIGKSSLMEAFSLVTDPALRDSSRSARVMVVQPVGTDLPTEIEVEVTTGEFHFTLMKRYHRDTCTRLQIHAPVIEELAGRQADDRLGEILGETMDPDLANALHMGQDDKQLEQAVPNPWGGALVEALDEASRERVGCRLDSTLLDRAADERSRWFTPTGREKKELKSLTTAVRDAQAQLDEVRRAQDELDGCVAEHARVARQLAVTSSELDQASKELEGLSGRRARLAEAEQALEQAAARLEAAEARLETARAAAAQREELAERVAQLTTQVADLAEADGEDEAHRAEVAERAATSARAAENGAALAEESAAKAATAAIALKRAELANQFDLMRNQREAALARARAEKAAAVPSLVVEALAETSVSVDGGTQTMAAGATRELQVERATTVEVPGVLRISVTPGQVVERLSAEARDEERALAERLDAAIADIEAQMERMEDASAPTQLGEARAAAEAATEAAETARRQAKEATEQAAAAAEEWTSLRARHERAETLITAARETVAREEALLEEARTRSGDSDLATALAAAESAAAAARRGHDAAGDAVKDLASDALSDRVEALERKVAALESRRDDGREQLTALATKARLMSDQGLHTRLQDALTERDAAVAEAEREHRRAAAAQRLWETLDRHRADAETAYRDPFRTRIEELGKALLGPSFSVEMDHDLTVARRRLDGHTVDVGQLSAGAREQLALIGRVACASLAARDGAGAPLVLDDTLGFSDPERRRGISRVLSEATAGCQVIVLTCDPDRYRELEGADLIQL